MESKRLAAVVVFAGSVIFIVIITAAIQGSPELAAAVGSAATAVATMFTAYSTLQAATSARESREATFLATESLVRHTEPYFQFNVIRPSLTLGSPPGTPQPTTEFALAVSEIDRHLFSDIILSATPEAGSPIVYSMDTHDWTIPIPTTWIGRALSVTFQCTDRRTGWIWKGEVSTQDLGSEDHQFVPYRAIPALHRP
ncbi:hypothetical protein [Williamsia sp. DF01-3]|uniref:hypothetical protein n=1 Tax=Williamsia sp. DF01-3 TaxID=2934157 RepID=UPI001FF18461|nr:hypothetical protein [Williamsia sp. DF01-3]MCK0515713.1 hypothetical protein [Williamsia sp. DF01-3]